MRAIHEQQKNERTETIHALAIILLSHSDQEITENSVQEIEERMPYGRQDEQKDPFRV